MHGSDIGLTIIHACSYRNINSKIINVTTMRKERHQVIVEMTCIHDHLEFRLAPDSLQLSL